MDPSQLSRIWDEHHARLVLIARASARVESDAEDAVQEAFMALALCDQSPRDVLAWMVRVVSNRLISSGRSDRRRRDRETRHGDWFESVGRGETVDGETVDGERLTGILRRLPDRQRQVVVMHHWGEMTFAEIAAATGTSRSTTHRHYTKALQLLRQQLDWEDNHVRG